MTLHQQLARARWPGYAVSGDGPWALVNASLAYVHLYVWALMANADLEARCDRGFCKLVHLEEPRRKSVRRATSNPADQEKD
jgi:hypothetical protein